MNWFHIIIDCVFYVNIFIALIIVFREPRDIASTYAWLLILVFVPIVGLIAYAFVGRRLPKSKLFEIQDQEQLQLDERLQNQGELIDSDELKHISDSERGTIQYFEKSSQAFITDDNSLLIFTDGKILFNQIFKDIEKAKKYIHIEFYTIYDDVLGNKLLNLLIKKAKEGVKVRILYDSWGSMGVRPKFYDPLRAVGGEAYPFLQTRTAWTDFRMNFRDHRKIIVIDGKTAYTGGFNVGDQYIGLKEKFGYWRDTHIRVIGTAIYALQSRFILDWNVTVRTEPLNVNERFFPVQKNIGHTKMQIITSGPDTDIQQIKMGYLRLINSAHRKLWIQSPYLIPDDSILDALKLAARSGVDVRIMIPCKPDHAFVYRATEYYAKYLSKYGIKIYKYKNGFLHAKTVIVDDKMCSIGSANFDFRSFKLNFEVNAFIFDKYETNKLSEIFKNDMNNSCLFTYEMFKQQSVWIKFKQSISRLLSPIL